MVSQISKNYTQIQDSGLGEKTVSEKQFIAHEFVYRERQT